jgi:hypothetical protein
MILVKKEYDVPLEARVIKRIASKALKFYALEPSVMKANMAVQWTSDTEATVSFDLDGKHYDVAVLIADQKLTLSSQVPDPMALAANLAIGLIGNEIKTWVKTWQDNQPA